MRATAQTERERGKLSLGESGCFACERRRRRRCCCCNAARAGERALTFTGCSGSNDGNSSSESGSSIGRVFFGKAAAESELEPTMM